MRLFYSRAPFGNFGDEMNEWLFPRLLPAAFDDDTESLFVGIGSILSWPPQKERIAVFGLGFGHGPELAGERLAFARKHWKFYCVRGPLTSAKIGLSPTLGVTDPAALGARIYRGSKPSGASRPVLVPHWSTARKIREPLMAACAATSIDYVDPHWGVERVLGMIKNSSLVLAESLHGAIMADAFRVPWVPLVDRRKPVSLFKWQDWCGSLEMTYHPVAITFSAASAWKLWERKLSADERTELLAKELKDALATAPSLSREATLNARLDTLEERFAAFSKDFSAGLFGEPMKSTIRAVSVTGS